MIVERLALEGFIGYRERCELDLAGRRTIGIVGPNESGKSTLLRAICYAMHGQIPTPQGTIREVNLLHDTADDALVELTVRLPDGGRLDIKRGRTKKNEAILEASGIGRTNPKKVQAHIERTLRLGYDDFVALSYFVQGDIHQFMSGNKRTYFQRWTESLRGWARLEDSTKERERDALGALRIAENSLLQVNETIGNKEDIRAELRAAQSNARKAEEKAELIDGQVQRLKSELQAQEHSEEMREALDTLVQQQRSLQYDIRDAEARLKALRRDYRNVKSGKCPLLGRQCKPLESAGEDQRKQLNVQAVEIKKRKAELDGRDEDLYYQIKKIKDGLTDSPVSKIKAQLDQARRDLQDANREIQRCNRAVAQADVNLEAVRKALDKKDQLDADASEHRVALRRAQFLRFMCGKSGIPAQRIEAELTEVGKRCNWVLGRLDYPKRIRFSGYRELAAVERVCPLCGSEKWRSGFCRSCGNPRPHKRKEEPTVTILDGTSERLFALESGGAQTLQSFAVRLASGLFVSSMTGVPMRMVMLDEVFAHLDASNRQKLMSLVVDKLASVFGLQQQFVVSHQEDIINVVDDMIVVRRKRGSSTARWA